jgi:hypothetical protein
VGATGWEDFSFDVLCVGVAILLLVAYFFGGAACWICMRGVFFGWVISLVWLVAQVHWEWQSCELACAGLGLQVGSRT